MNLIHKQLLWSRDIQVLDLPFNSKILKVAEQNKELYVWYIFDHDNIKVKEEYTLYIYGTGNSIDTYDERTGKHIDTVLMSSGLVWHVFLAV